MMAARTSRMPDIEAEIAAIRLAHAAIRDVVARQVPLGSRQVSERVAHVLHLGRILLAASNQKSLRMALGFPQRTENYGMAQPFVKARPVEFAARAIDARWAAFVKNPPMNVRDQTYNGFIAFFDANWPADLEWPRHIPRPSRRKAVA